MMRMDNIYHNVSVLKCEAILVIQQQILTLSLISTGIPASINIFTMLTFPSHAALCSGDLPYCNVQVR